MNRQDSNTWSQLRFSEIENVSFEEEDILRRTLIHFANAYTSTIVEDEYNKNSMKVDWHCFECKCPIKVDLEDILTGKDFDQKKLFCDLHKPAPYTNTYKKNFVFQKYVIAFNSFIKQTIIKNSKVTTLTAWKELQGSEWTSQLIQPESRSLYRNQKRKTKKLFTFKSVLGKKKSQDQ